MLANITAADGSNFVGKVRKVSPVVDTQTRNTLVYVDLPVGSVKAGMFAKGDFNMGNSNTLAVPQQALVMRDGFTYVFLVNKNHARQTKIQTGKRLGSLVEVMSGLTHNQAIIASGGAFLSDNDLVKVVNVLPTKKMLPINMVPVKLLPIKIAPAKK